MQAVDYFHSNLQEGDSPSLPTSMPDAYDDNSSSITRAGLRQTDLVSQLENSSKKKHRLKTQSILFNGSAGQIGQLANTSKSTLIDQGSIYSGNSYNSQSYQSQPNQPTYRNGSTERNVNNYAPQIPYNNYQNFNNHPHSQQQPPSQQQLQPQHNPNQQQQYYNNYPPNQIPIQKQRPQINPGYNQQPHQQPLQYYQQPHPNQYSNQYPNQYPNQNPNYQIQQQNIQRQNLLINQKRLSSSHGIIDSPMSTPTEEFSRKLSFSSIVGGVPAPKSAPLHEDVTSDDIQAALLYIDENNWEDIDEDDTDLNQLPPGAGYHLDSKKLATNFEKLQIENRSLKKKLKDIELGYDSNSLMVYDNEKFTQLEANYEGIINSYATLKQQMDDLTKQNEDYFNDITKLQKKVTNKGDENLKYLNFIKTVLKKLPDHINSKNSFQNLVSAEIPDPLVDTYEECLKKVANLPENNSDKINNTTITTTNNNDNNNNKSNHNNGKVTNTVASFSNDDILNIFRDEVKVLNLTINRLNREKSQIEKTFTQQLQDERRTIRVASIQRSLHNEFDKKLSNNVNKFYTLQNFFLVQPTLDLNDSDIP